MANGHINITTIQIRIRNFNFSHTVTVACGVWLLQNKKKRGLGVLVLDALFWKISISE
jgi:hypothetical protein